MGLPAMTLGSTNAELLRSDRMRQYVAILRELKAPADIIEMAERLAAELAAKEQRERPAPQHAAHP